jgi:hypothetical protein
MIKKVLFICLLLMSFTSLHAQKIITQLPDTISNWKKENKIGFDVSQNAFLNWNAGGNNSVAGLLKGNFKRDYIEDKCNWSNELIFRYGINKQEGREIRKTDDQLQINSTFGYRSDTISNWFYAGKFNFNTQFANGYAYPNTDLAISKPFAPAYVFLGIGTEYKRKDLNLNVYISPLTLKTTFVFDERLSNQGAFGVDIGKKHRTEVGFLLTNNYKTEIYKNMVLENRLSLYSDYINNFGNIDVDWQIILEMTVNEYVKATIGTHLLYDDDIKFKEEENGVQVTRGPRIQLKQMLGIGFVYSF